MRWSAFLLVLPGALCPAIVPVSAATAGQVQTPEQAYIIANSAVLTVRSDAGEAYQVYVAWPDGTPPPGGWPVLYLLDGNDQFPVTVASARRMARMPERSGVQPGIIVGVDAGPPSRRSRDYTPRAAPSVGLGRGPGTRHPTGGADAFLTFLAARIKPLVEGRWPVDPGRQTLAGHSFGGLASLYDLHRFGHFTGYVAISPSLWFGGGTVLPDPSAIEIGKLRVLIEAGSHESRAGANGPDAGGLTGEILAAHLRQRGVDASFRLLEGQTHGTTMLAAMGDLLKFAFGKE